MGERVPADDLPAGGGSRAVPASDLPGAAARAAPAAAPKAGADPTRWYDYVPAVPLAETAAALATGTAGAFAGGLAGLSTAAGIREHDGRSGAQIAQDIQERVTYQPRSKSGKAMLHGVSAPFDWLARMADKAGGAVTDTTGSPALGTATNVAVQALPMAVGGAVPALARAMPRAPAPKASGKGFALTPDEAGAGIITRTAANLAGEPKVSKGISAKNQPEVNNRILNDLGVEKETLPSREVHEEIRANEGKAYAVMRKSGTVTKDAAFKAELEEVVKDIRAAASDFEHRADSPLLKTVESLSKKPTADANSLVSEIINLRNDAKKAFKQGDNELGRGSLAAAEAMENLLDRHVELLAKGGEIDPAAMEAFRAARVRISKSYAADRALEGAGYNAQKYAKMLESKVPLTGGALEVAEFGRDFPRSSRSPAQQAGAGGPTIFDAGLAAINAAKTGGKSLLAELPTMFARPIARGVIASDPYQAAFIRNPDAMRAALASPEGRAALGLGTVPTLANARQPQRGTR